MSKEAIIDEQNSHPTSFVITFLVVNRIQELPRVAVASALAITQSDILIGYINSNDIIDLPKSERLKYIKLESDENFSSSSREYSNFLSNDFYKIVKLKWLLLVSAFDLGYDYVIYSDTDVIWNRNPIPTLTSTFLGDQELEVLIQGFTSDPDSPNLCMGFVCFRNSQKSLEFVSLCERSHFKESMHHERIGDDTIVTKIFTQLGYPKWIKELPQATFPTGWMINLYASKSRYPGLNSPIPYIFHTNWVVGLENKRLLTRIFLSASQRKFYSVPMTIKWRLRLLFFYIKHRLESIFRYIRSKNSN